MLVIALSRLVVIPQHTDPGIHQREPVFELVTATCHRSGKPPNDQFYECGFGKSDTFTET